MFWEKRENLAEIFRMNSFANMLKSLVLEKILVSKIH